MPTTNQPGVMPSNIERKARRKKQTRLKFDPLDLSSSPVNNNMSPAKVSYELPATGQTPASSRTRALGGDSESESDELLPFGRNKSRTTPGNSKKNGTLPFKPLPTPAKSSQTQIAGGASSNDLEDESGANTHESPKPFQRSTKITSSTRSKCRRTGLDGVDDSSEGSPPEEESYTPSKNKQKGKGKGKAVHLPTINLARDSEDEAVLPRSRNPMSQKAKALLPERPTRGSTRKQQTYVELSSDSSSDDELDLPPPKPTQKVKDLFGSKSKSRNATVESSDSDEIITRSQPRRQQRSIVDEDEDSDSEDPVSSPQKRQRKPQIDGESEEEDPISSPLKRNRPTVESDDSDIVSSPLKRRRNVEVESSEDDLPSPSKIPHRSRSASKSSPTRYTRQSKTRRHRTEKEKTLELLKRKRAGEDIEALTESESESEEESGPELRELSEFEDESEPEVLEKPRKPARRAKENEDGYDSDFVDDDEDGNIGIPNPAFLDIPLEFTHAAHKPLKEHFKDAIEWMVHNKINPAFARDDPLYLQAFKKLDDEYGGYAKSKFVSSQWTADFTRAIYARPHLLERRLAEGEGIDVTGEVKCDVCNHRKHTPKYEIQFEGKAYHRDSLEEVEQDSDESSDEDDESSSSNSDTQSVNADGQRIPSEKTKWFSGSFCRGNATQAHSLIHWKYALNTWVVGNLETEGYLTSDKLAEREKMKAKKRREYANDVVDKWGTDGHIKDLYRDFKLNLESAREAKQTRWSAGKFMGLEK